MIDEGPGIVVERLPSAKPAWEPIIVTTLRRYVRRQASAGVLHRIAGGAAQYRLLNDVWDFDNRALQEALGQSQDLGVLDFALSVEERRIALLQVIAEHDRNNRMMPTTAKLGRFFGVSRQTIDHDLDHMRAEGRIACRPVGVKRDPRREIRLAGAAP